jgi:lipopolysaccharide export system protein LptC
LPRIELRGEKIIALIKAEKLLSSDPVQITRGPDVFTANNMDFDIQSGQYQLSGRVRGTLAPTSQTPQARQP